MDPTRPLTSSAEGHPPEVSRPPAVHRVVAVLEVILCSDYPTQTAIAATFAAAGYGPFAANGDLRLGFVVALSLIDTALLTGLILLFLVAHGERPRDVFLGTRPASGEVLLGVWPLTVLALTIGVGLMATIQRYAPRLHTVTRNPLEALVRSPHGLWWFALVLIVAGGLREELQRAFLLRRFERSLGGATVGLVVTSVAFGAGHLTQGEDASIVIGLLGAFWGMIYLRRRSVVAPVVSHSCFNLLEIVRFLTAGA